MLRGSIIKTRITIIMCYIRTRIHESVLVLIFKTDIKRKEVSMVAKKKKTHKGIKRIREEVRQISKMCVLILDGEGKNRKIALNDFKRIRGKVECGLWVGVLLSAAK